MNHYKYSKKSNSNLLTSNNKFNYVILLIFVNLLWLKITNFYFAIVTWKTFNDYWLKISLYKKIVHTLKLKFKLIQWDVFGII